MDFELIIIFLFIIAIVSIVMGTLGGVAKRALKLRERRMEIEARSASPNAAALLEKMEKMEERIRSLERIATDGGNNLAAEIEALRLPQDANDNRENIQ